MSIEIAVVLLGASLILAEILSTVREGLRIRRVFAALDEHAFRAHQRAASQHERRNVVQLEPARVPPVPLGETSNTNAKGPAS